MPDAREASERIKGLALALGFDLVGVAPALPSPESRALRPWLASGYAGRMQYLKARADEREDPRRVFEGAHSIVAVALAYDPGHVVGQQAQVSRYAAGDDYHEVLGERLRTLAAAIEQVAPDRAVRTRSYVDTGPVLERVVAAYAGLGWIGKNTCLIHPKLGSYLFLGVVLTDLELAPDVREPDHCGTCTACIDACPTDAFVTERVLDARRCIAYTTIEDPGPVPLDLRAGQGDHLFGCDVCQEVCPWNQRSARDEPRPDPLGLRDRLAPRAEWMAASLEWILSLDREQWLAVTRGSAIRRARHRGLLRNALVAAGNLGDERLRPALEEHAACADPLLAEHARWALDCIDGRPGS